MKMTLEKVADLVEGTLSGDGEMRISGASIIRDAQPGEITFLDNHDLIDCLRGCDASAVLVPQEMDQIRIPQIAVDNVHISFSKIVSRFRPVLRSVGNGVSPAAYVSTTARIGPNVTIQPGAFVDDHVEVGEGTTIHSGARLLAGCKLADEVVVYPNVVLYENTIIGPRVIIHSGAVIGAYGFGYETIEGRHQISSQMGFVEIEADVEVGAGTTIDRGTYGSTHIGEGTKIDNLVMIAHNCRIGKHNIICAQVGIAGSCVTGDYVVMAGQVGLRDHLTIGEGASLGAQSGHMSDVPSGARLMGYPAVAERDFWQVTAITRKLPDLRRRIKQLERQLQQLTNASAS